MLKWQLVWLGLVLCLACGTSGVRADDAFEFQPVTDFFQLPEGWKFGKCSAVAINRAGEVVVCHRGQHPVICFDANGKYLRSWGDDLLQMAHGLRIDPEQNIWTTDISNHRVFKFDPQGKLLLALGTGKPGSTDDAFNKPSDMAFGMNGEFFISDGYINTRVKQYAASGKLLKTWGQPGKGPGEFDLVHAIIVDRQGRVLVADRNNERIQIFDREGTFQGQWPGFAPYGLAFSPEGTLYVADAVAHQVLRLDKDGKVQQRIGMKGSAAGEFNVPHMLAFDQQGNLFVAEVDNLRVQKLVKK